MKLIKATSLALVALIVIGVAGCVRKIDEFGDINTNPGIIAEPITAALYTNVLSGMGGEVWNPVPGLYAQIFSETQYTEASRYAKQDPDFSGYYSGVLFDCQNIINYNTDKPEKAAVYGANANQIAIARILKAWWYLRVVDFWGKVPYSEALQFNGTIPYDDDQAIYNDLFSELKNAANQIDVSGKTFQGDILFGGDLLSWKRFANSIRLMMGVRIAKADANKGKAEVLDALSSSGGVIQDNSQNAALDYPGGNFNNPFYAYYNITQRFDYAVSKPLIDYMQNNGDKRAISYGSESAVSGVVKGFPYGLTRSDAIAWTSLNPDWAYILSDGLRSPQQPMYILTAAQVYLARAEAAQRGWTTENAANMYSTGLQRGWEQWGVYNAADFGAFMAMPNIDLAGGSQLQKIGMQRWVASFPDGKEAWNITRSTGYPDLTPAPGTTEGIPHRYAISQTQYDLNGENTQAAATAYTVNGIPDSQYGRVWWDK